MVTLGGTFGGVVGLAFIRAGDASATSLAADITLGALEERVSTCLKYDILGAMQSYLHAAEQEDWGERETVGLLLSWAATTAARAARA